MVHHFTNSIARRAACRRGSTLTEVAVATMLVGVVLAGALSLMGATLRTQRTAASEPNGALLAEMMLAEIVSLAYDDPENGGGVRGIDAGEFDANKRKNFDDIDDYENYTETEIADHEGNSIPGASGWQRSVRVYWAERVGGNIWLWYDTGLKRIRVTVTSPSGVVTEREALRCNFGSLEQAPLEDTTVVNWVGIELKIGTEATAFSGANLVNHVVNP